MYTVLQNLLAEHKMYFLFLAFSSKELWQLVYDFSCIRWQYYS